MWVVSSGMRTPPTQEVDGNAREEDSQTDLHGLHG